MKPVEFRKSEKAEVSYQLYGYGARPASWSAYRDGILVARIVGVRQGYTRSGYRVEDANGKRVASCSRLKDARREVCRLFA